MTQSAALPHRTPNRLTAVGRQSLMEGAGGHSDPNPLADRAAEGMAVCPSLTQSTGSGAVLLAGQPQQQMFTAHIAVSQAGGILLGQSDGP